MTDNLKQSVQEVDKGLARSWIDLSTNVRTLAEGLMLKAAGTELADDAGHLSTEASRLCDHVERLHEDVLDLIENIETRVPVRELETPPPVTHEAVEKEKIQIQRESHELRSDFKDIIKALFLWRDDPVQRARDKQ